MDGVDGWINGRAMRRRKGEKKRAGGWGRGRKEGRKENPLSHGFLFSSTNHICTDGKIYLGSCLFRTRHEQGA